VALNSSLKAVCVYLGVELLCHSHEDVLVAKHGALEMDHIPGVL